MQRTSEPTMPAPLHAVLAAAVARTASTAPLIVCAVAFAVRAAAIYYWQFQGLYGQDPYAYYDYALALRTALLTGQPLPHFFWPPAYPLLVVFASALFGITPLAAQLVNLIAGSLLVLLTFLTAREAAQLVAYDPTRANQIGCIAALWLTCAMELVQSSISVMADTLGLTFAVGSAWLLLRAARTGAPRWLYGSAALLACAFLARIQMALLIAPWAIFTFAQPQRAIRAARTWMSAGLIGVATVAPYLFWAWRDAQLGLSSYAADPGFAQWSPLNFVHREFVTPDGYLQFPYPSSMYYAVAALRGGALTPFVAPFAALGIWTLWQRRALALLIQLLGWGAAIYLFIAGMPWQNLRFAFPFYPPLAILAAFGLSAFAASRMSRALGRHPIGLVLMLVVFTQLTLGYHEVDQFMTTVRGNQAVADWLKRALPSDATVITFGLTLTLAHETPFHVVELYEQTPDRLTPVLIPDHTFLLLDVRDVATQWAGRAPAMNYEFLRDAVGLDAIGVNSTYTLYRVRGTARVNP